MHLCASNEPTAMVFISYVCRIQIETWSYLMYKAPQWKRLDCGIWWNTYNICMSPFITGRTPCTVWNVFRMCARLHSPLHKSCACARALSYRFQLAAVQARWKAARVREEGYVVCRHRDVRIRFATHRFQIHTHVTLLDAEHRCPAAASHACHWFIQTTAAAAAMLLLHSFAVSRKIRPPSRLRWRLATLTRARARAHSNGSTMKCVHTSWAQARLELYSYQFPTHRRHSQKADRLVCSSGGGLERAHNA